MDTLISEAYRKQQSFLHEQHTNYGVASCEFADTVSEIINNNGIVEVLDYGAGKGRLAKSLNINQPINLQCYDPAIPQYSQLPKPAELVACIDVLEHIEPDLIDSVLDHLQRLTTKLGFFTIHSKASSKQLPDGRNAHLIQESTEWWLPKIVARFDLHQLNRGKNGFLVLVLPKKPMT